jgi:putative FmdB family regulatory protein
VRRESVPLYEYKCRKCGRRTEKIENIAGPHLKKCPYCGGKVESLISAPAIQFKGSGWYVTDYAGKSNSGDKSEEAKDEKSSTDKHKKDSPAKDSDSKESTKKETSPSERKAEKSEKKK